MATRKPALQVVKRTPLESLVNDYLAHVRAEGGKPKTQRYYRSFLVGQLLPWCDKVGISDPAKLNQRAIDRFAADLRSRKAQASWVVAGPRPSNRYVAKPRGDRTDGLAEATVHSYIRALNAFLKWARSDGEIEATGITLKPLPKQVRKVLDQADIQHMEESAGEERDKLLIRLLGDTGMRASELVGLTVHDFISIGPNRFLRIKGKGGDERKVAIDPSLYKRLERYRDKGRPDKDSDDLWQGLRKSNATGRYEQLSASGLGQMLASVGEDAEIDKDTNPHAFRHSFITRKLRQGRPETQIARWVGHKTTQMIALHYDHQNEDDDAKALVESLRLERKQVKDD